MLVKLQLWHPQTCTTQISLQERLATRRAVSLCLLYLLDSHHLLRLGQTQALSGCSSLAGFLELNHPCLVWDYFNRLSLSWDSQLAGLRLSQSYSLRPFLLNVLPFFSLTCIRPALQSAGSSAYSCSSLPYPTEDIPPNKSDTSPILCWYLLQIKPEIIQWLTTFMGRDRLMMLEFIVIEKCHLAKILSNFPVI